MINNTDIEMVCVYAHCLKTNGESVGGFYFELSKTVRPCDRRVKKIISI